MPMSSPKAGVHYPGNLAAVRSWFPDDAACLDYLDWLRWPDGFRCTHCGSEKGWRLPAGGWSCGGCRKRVRVLAGTVFQDTRTPLTVWFEAAWLMAVTKNGVSAASLQPLLGLGCMRPPGRCATSCGPRWDASPWTSQRRCRGRRDLHRRRQNRRETRPWRARQGVCRDRRGVQGQGVRPLPAPGRPEDRRQEPWAVPAPPHHARLGRDQRRSAVLPTGHRRHLRAQAVQHQALRPARPRGAAGGPSGGQPAEALARRYPPVRRLRGAPAGLPRRSIGVGWGLCHVRGRPKSAVVEWISWGNRHSSFCALLAIYQQMYGHPWVRRRCVAYVANGQRAR